MSTEIIVPALREITQELISEIRDMGECDERYTLAERKLLSTRDELAQRRLNVGRLLSKARPMCPHGTWMGFLEKLSEQTGQKVSDQTARNWMALAGYVETQIPNVLDLPASSIPTHKEVTESRGSKTTDADHPQQTPYVEYIRFKGELRPSQVEVFKVALVSLSHNDDPNVQALTRFFRRFILGDKQ